MDNTLKQSLKNLERKAPRIPKQADIARRIEAFYSATDAIAQRHKGLATVIEQLQQALLPAAIRGHEMPTLSPKSSEAVLLSEIQALIAAAPVFEEEDDA